MDNLNDILLSVIECPACGDYMTKFIFICHTGHSICSDCHLTVKECPICWSSMTNLRNFDLESIAELLYYPCQYYSSGCTSYLTISEEKEHHETCRNDLIVLHKNFRHPRHIVADIHHIFRDYDDEACGWSGPRSALEDHALTHHESKAWMQEESLDRWRDNLSELHQIQLIRAYDELFYITRMETADMVHWAVQYIGNSENCKQFSYLLHIYCDNDKFRAICFNEICQDESKTLDEIIEAGKCSMVPIPVLKTFKDDRKSVWYKVKILKLF